MDYLRWILLAVAVLVVVIVYVWSRTKKQEAFSNTDVMVEDVPSFSATQTGDGWIDGVSPVRIVAAAEDIKVVDEVSVLFDGNTHDDIHKEKIAADKITTAEPTAEQATLDISEPEKNTEVAEQNTSTETTEPLQDNNKTAASAEDKISTDDVIALYLIVKDQEPLKGESILSAALANRLQYGDMKIFHRKDSHKKTIFSMANMHEPGHFDSVKIHQLRTRGVSFFIQLSLCDDPVKALDDMLICAHSMAGMLATHLCDQNRHLLNETFTRALREKAKHFSA